MNWKKIFTDPELEKPRLLNFLVRAVIMLFALILPNRVFPETGIFGLGLMLVFLVVIVFLEPYITNYIVRFLKKIFGEKE